MWHRALGGSIEHHPVLYIRRSCLGIFRHLQPFTRSHRARGAAQLTPQRSDGRRCACGRRPVLGSRVRRPHLRLSREVAPTHASGQGAAVLFHNACVPALRACWWWLVPCVAQPPSGSMPRGLKEWGRPSEACDHCYGMKYESSSMSALESSHQALSCGRLKEHSVANL